MEHTVILSQFCLSDTFPFFIKSFIFKFFHWFIAIFELISYEIQFIKCHWMEIFRNNSNVPPPPVKRWPDFSNFQPSEFSSTNLHIQSRGLQWWKMMSSLTRLVMIGSRDHDSVTWGFLRQGILIFTSRSCLS